MRPTPEQTPTTPPEQTPEQTPPRQTPDPAGAPTRTKRAAAHGSNASGRHARRNMAPSSPLRLPGWPGPGGSDLARSARPDRAGPTRRGRRGRAGRHVCPPPVPGFCAWHLHRALVRGTFARRACGVGGAGVQMQPLACTCGLERCGFNAQRLLSGGGRLEMQPWDYRVVSNGHSVVGVALLAPVVPKFCVSACAGVCGRFRAAVARRELPRSASLLQPAWAWVCVALPGQGVLASASMCPSLLGSALVCFGLPGLLGSAWVRLCLATGSASVPSGSLQACQGVGVCLDLHPCARVGLRLPQSA